MAKQQSSAEKAQSKLNPSTAKTNQLGKQLVYPKDFLTRKDHPGLCVMFELSKLSYSPTRAYQSGLGSGGSNLKSKSSLGVENTQTAIQNKSDAASRTSLRSDVSEKIAGYVKTGMSIILPPPDSWIENLSVEWGVADGLGDIAREFQFGKSIYDGDWNAAAKQAGVGLPNLIGNISNAATDGATKPLVNGLKNVFELASGIRENNFAEILFNTVQNRTFPFRFTMTPRNSAEAEIIHAIYHRFKYGALPELLSAKNSAFYVAPYIFDISFIDVKTGNASKFWTKFNSCALTNINIDRTPQGEFNVIKTADGDIVPQTVTIDLQFTELTKINKDASENPNDSY